MKSIFKTIKSFLNPAGLFTTGLGIAPFSGNPTIDQLMQYSTMVPNSVELTRSVLYDTLAYAQAGQTLLSFFQTPQGQGGKTNADTNMTSAGQLPQPQAFLIQTIELWFYPGAAIIPSTFGAGAIEAFVNDTYKFYRYGGYLTMQIGSKVYVTEAPLMKFPPRNGLSGFGAMSNATTPAGALSNATTYGTNNGPTYEINPPILLEPNVNFNVNLNWPAAAALSAAGTVMCSMSGYLYRRSQ